MDSGHVKNIIIYYKSDDLARYTDLASGTAQLVSIQASNWNLVSNSPKYSYYLSPPWTGLASWMAMNTKLFPTNITDFRQAIVHAINYTDIIRKVYQGHAVQFMGPEYPGWKDFYDLGNFAPYQYNLTLAKQYLAESNVNVANLAPLTMHAVADCSYCISASTIIQSDLAQIGIPVDVVALLGPAFYSPYGAYTMEAANPSSIAQLTYVGHNVAPALPTPADNWILYLSNESYVMNAAIYYNPVVQKAINSFFTSNNLTYIKALFTQAQAQVYEDAPYGWLGVNQLPGISGSWVWQTGTISSFYFDSTWIGEDTSPTLNTITFASGSNSLTFGHSLLAQPQDQSYLSGSWVWQTGTIRSFYLDLLFPKFTYST